MAAAGGAIYRDAMTDYVGRYAPSPTGDLHLGNALAAVATWARARRSGGRVLLRIDDLDQPRCVPGSAERITEDLQRLGLDFDAGPDTEDAGAPYVQSRCGLHYNAALEKLRGSGSLFACRCSRKDIQRAASAPQDGDDGQHYPGTCRDLGLPFDDPSEPVAWRFRVPPGTVKIEDALCGVFEQDVSRQVGDFVVRRKDGIVAYHLACVVDDARQGVTEVVRGRDLLDSSPRQVLLLDALGIPAPTYAHVPLWLEADGARLAKRKGAGTIRHLFEGGEKPSLVLGRIGHALGVCGAGDKLGARALMDRMSDRVLGVPAVTESGPLD